jgi:predicted RNA-binding Zn ribbon-like protein
MEARTAGLKTSLTRAENKAVFNEVIEFREMLVKMASDLAQGRTVSKSLLDRINRILQGGSGHFEIRRVGDAYEKRFLAEFEDLSGLLVTVAESAADLLCFGDLAHVKKCENEHCVLYFHDISKNHRRRWCSMSGCGNRAKANAFYQRKRSAKKPEREKE